VNGVQAQALDAELTALQGQVKQLRAETRGCCGCWN
jgi:hypothetical protein